MTHPIIRYARIVPLADARRFIESVFVDVENAARDGAPEVSDMRRVAIEALNVVLARRDGELEHGPRSA